MSIWNKNGRDQDVIDQIRLDIIRILGINSSAQMNYEPFNLTDEEKEKMESQQTAAKKSAKN